jgi:hypothetical protein
MQLNPEWVNAKREEAGWVRATSLFELWDKIEDFRDERSKAFGVPMRVQFFLDGTFRIWEE